MPYPVSDSNTSAPSFSAWYYKWLHKLGNALVFPCHWGINQTLRTFDTFRFYRSTAMHQFPFPIELLSRPLRFTFGLLFAVIGAPFALIGQAIKVAVSAAGKLPYTQYEYKPNKDKAPLLQNPPVPNALNVMTWNLAAMHSVLRWANGTRPVQARMIDAVTYIMNKNTEEQPDVLCFQEVFTEKATGILTRGLRERYPYIVHNVGQNTVGLNSGLMICSKYPISTVNFKPFEERYGQNALSQKGSLNVVVDLSDDKKVVVTNVHLEAGGKLSRKYVLFGEKKDGATVKEAQVTQALNAAETLEKSIKQQHVLSAFAGDTNSGLLGKQNLVQQKLVSFAYADPAGTQARDTYTSTCLKKRILTHDNNGATNYKTKEGKGRVDYVTFKAPQHDAIKGINESAVSVLRDTGDISDHVPVLGKMHL